MFFSNKVHPLAINGAINPTSLLLFQVSSCGWTLPTIFPQWMPKSDALKGQREILDKLRERRHIYRYRVSVSGNCALDIASTPQI